MEEHPYHRPVVMVVIMTYMVITTTILVSIAALNYHHT